MTRAGFTNDVGIGDMCPVHMDDIGDPIAQNLLRFFQRANSADNEAGDVECRSGNLLARWQLVPDWLIHRCHKFEIVVIAPAHIQEIDHRSEEHTSELQSLMRNSY